MYVCTYVSMYVCMYVHTHRGFKVLGFRRASGLSCSLFLGFGVSNSGPWYVCVYVYMYIYIYIYMYVYNLCAKAS